jgi:solute carrier family 50 protein (sugar transporter)
MNTVYLQGDVIRTKCTKTLPFPLILSGTVVTFLWLLYGIIIKNPFIQVSPLYAFLSCHKKGKLYYLLVSGVE